MCCLEENDKDSKGEGNMIVTTLESIEKRVNKNSSSNAKMISNFQRRIEKRGFNKGRVRLRNTVEQQILNSFKRK